MALTQLHKDYLKLAKTKPNLTEEFAAECLGVSRNRVTKIHRDLLQAGLIRCESWSTGSTSVKLEA